MSRDPNDLPDTQDDGAVEALIQQQFANLRRFVVAAVGSHRGDLHDIDVAQALRDEADLVLPQPAALRDVMAERVRQRQREVEGYSSDDDDKNSCGELAAAAACYATRAGMDAVGRFNHRRVTPEDWPWDHALWKPTDTRRDLVKAGALILAEIERLDRREAAHP